MATLLIFAKQPVPGRVKTRLASHIGDHAAVRLYQAFLRDLCARLTNCAELQISWWVDGDPAALVTELASGWSQGWTAHRQPGGNLGHRLQAAFESAFAEQTDPAAVIGTDCPQLGSAQLATLFSPLKTGSDAVLLPAEDGGYAGLALAAPAPETFRNIPWSTAQVAEKTLARLRRSGKRVTVLSPVFDVDTVTELTRLTDLLRSHPERAPHTAAVLSTIQIPEAE